MTELAALRPLAAGGPPRPEIVRTALDEQLRLVGGWCDRAVAEGWSTGRIAHASTSEAPSRSEVAAILAAGPVVVLGEADDRARAAEARWDVARRGFEREPAPPPIVALARELGLSPLAEDVLLVVSAPSLWGELARIYTIIKHDPDRRHVDELLIAQLLGPRRATRLEIARELDADGPLVRHGVLQIGPGARPFAPLAADPVVLRRLRGAPDEVADDGEALTWRPADRALEQLAIPSDVVSGLTTALETPTSRPLRLVISGRAGSGRRSLLAALVERAGRRLAIVDGERARTVEDLARALRGAALRGWFPCVVDLRAEDPVVRAGQRRVLAAHPGPIAFAVGPDETPPLEPGYVAATLPPLSEGERGAFWRGALAEAGLAAEPGDAMATRYTSGPGVITRVVAHAREGEGGLADRLEASMRQYRDGRIGQIATRVSRLATWDQVILPTEMTDSIQEFIGRVKARRTVYEAWGYGEVISTAQGLTALFSGPPGTGKTLVAGAIARELDCELYRVDLGSILSKWMGETERNLGQLFDVADDGQVILLFDEADSLFAKRTEVKTSGDRYANLEVNYLLQRLDSFRGVAILTTNLAGSIDPAFQRRMTLRLPFSAPDEEMRLALWRAHLPSRLPIAGPLDLETLAHKHQFSGGYIRNAALRAAFLAAQEGGGLTQSHLERAVTLEYRQMGRLAENGRID